MLFTEPLFLFLFLPLFLFCFQFFSRIFNYQLNNFLKLFIVCSTLVFYAWHRPIWLIPLCIAVIFDFIWSISLTKTENTKTRKLILTASIVQNLSLFFIFKYLCWIISIKFLADIPLISFAKIKLFEESKCLISMPAGISFYLFESMSYVIDVYRKKIKPPQNPLDFFSFIAMFPRFIAGPIVRYSDLSDQIKNWLGPKIKTGITLFMIGFIYKAFFADNFAIFNHYAFHNSEPDFISAWIGSLAFSFQLYFDFAGYSLMAIGLGKCLGFHFNKNFNNPYISKSITEFWERWHISLSSWLRDYLYISLGGNKCSFVRNCFNLFITMFIAGIWHGANFTFIIWGALQGFYLVLEKIFDKQLQKIPMRLRQIQTFILIVLGWIIFKADNWKMIKTVFKGILGFNGFANTFNSYWIQVNLLSLGISIMGIIYCFFISPKRQIPLEERDNFKPSVQFFILILFLISLCLCLSSQVVPFLYFQF